MIPPSAHCQLIDTDCSVSLGKASDADGRWRPWTLNRTHGARRLLKIRYATAFISLEAPRPSGSGSAAGRVPSRRPACGMIGMAGFVGLHHGPESRGCAGRQAGRDLQVLVKMRLHLALGFHHKPQAPAIAAQAGQGAHARKLPAYHSGLNTLGRLSSSRRRSAHQARWSVSSCGCVQQVGARGAGSRATAACPKYRPWAQTSPTWLMRIRPAAWRCSSGSSRATSGVSPAGFGAMGGRDCRRRCPALAGPPPARPSTKSRGSACSGSYCADSFLAASARHPDRSGRPGLRTAARPRINPASYVSPFTTRGKVPAEKPRNPARPEQHAIRVRDEAPFTAKSETVQRDWYVVDAAGQDPGSPRPPSWPVASAASTSPSIPRTSIPATTSWWSTPRRSS